MTWIIEKEDRHFDVSEGCELWCIASDVCAAEDGERAGSRGGNH